MKKAMAKHGLRLFAALFILFGTLFLTATRAEAQGLDNMMGQNLNWVTEAEAMTLLDGQLITLGDGLTLLTPGTPAYIDALNHLTYYKLVYASVEEGATVSEAAISNIKVVTDFNASKEGQALTEAVLTQLWTDLTAFLTF